MSVFEPVLNDLENPLVSILVYNYNYGRYLTECLDSLINQTYSNIEINFSDNASDDDSWDIAVEFAKKYPGRMTITRNRKNLGPDANFRNCYVNARGKYFINMCSDDVLAPEYVAKCVKTMEANPQLGFVMVHRAIIDEHSNRTDEAPFYNQSCTIQGEDKAAVYMMASVNPSVSQIMYSAQKVVDKTATGALVSRWYGTRILDFNLCTEYPVAYIKEPLLLHRIHGENHSLAAADNLMEVIGPYVLQHQFADTASIHNMNKVVDRLDSSIEKLAQQSLRYSVRALFNDDNVNAKKYYHLALVMSSEIAKDKNLQKIEQYWLSDKTEKAKLLQELKATGELVTRTVSYEPPPGSTPLQ